MTQMSLQLVDLEEVRRRGEDREPSAVLVDAELDYCRAQRRPWEHIGARMAAKRAVFEVLRASPVEDLPWHEVEIVRHRSGRVEVLLRGGTERLARSRGITALRLSMSHTRTLAAALVVCREDQPPGP
ncbi:hypothetical protein GF402_09120 [Candidatus Fermentibacteria bacterium]|nr:hypothetical protein [Candidatus Fermentibacteria bacterium]